jgi:NAD(P)-dependent dehydrogenase (short-subunit alcohol dehydrogenase family)
MHFQDHVVLITGGGTGIGRAIAHEVARAHGNVVILGRRANVLRDTRKELLKYGIGVLGLPTNVARRDEVDSAVRETLDLFGRIDALVNNAGIARFSRIESASLSDLDLMIDAHLRGPINLIQATLPSLKRNRGTIVNVSSIGGTVATPGRSYYGATKAALNHLTRSLARELAPEIRVNAVLPGPVDTPIYEDLGLSKDERKALVKQLVASTPSGRFAMPDEVARWVCYLLQDRNSWVTGSLITIDGGRSC